MQIVTRVSFLRKCIILILTLALIPQIFLGFDQHHDGLILATIRLRRQPQNFGGVLPFNQYGQFWADTFSLLTHFVQQKNIFLALRVITFFLYVLTAILIYIIGKLWRNSSFGELAVILFLATCPFYSTFRSDFFPWPSAVLMPLVTLITFLLIKSVSYHFKTPRSQTSALFVGFLSGACLFTRAQVGILLIPLIIVFYYKKNKKNLILPNVLGLISFVSAYSLYLQKKNSFTSLLNDEFIFGMSYARGATNTFHFPKFTMLLVSLNLVFLISSSFQNFVIKFITAHKKSIVIGLFLLLLIVTTTFLAKSSDFQDTFISLLRREGVSLSIACTIFYLIQRLRIFLRPKLNLLSVSPTSDAILVLALISQIQIWPLFDQMHSWWGSVPSVLLATETFSSIARLPTIKAPNQILIFRLLATCALFAVIVSVSSSAHTEWKSLRFAGVANISADRIIAQDMLRFNEFVSSNIPNRSSVLNLCDNANIFFSQNNYLSASRVFVLWPKMLENSQFLKSFTNAHPDFLLLCTPTQFPDSQVSNVSDQSRVLAIYVNQGYKPLAKLNLSGKTFTIFKPTSLYSSGF